MGVYDGPEGLVVAPVYKGLERLSKGLFLPHPLKDEHIRVHTHTNGQDDTCDSRERESGVKQAKNCQEEQNIEHHRHISDEPRYPIIDHHEYENHDTACKACHEPLLDGVSPKRWPHSDILDDLYRCWECTCPQHNGQVCRLLMCKGTRDLGMTPCYPLPDHRR